MTDPERVTSELKGIIDRVREDNILEAMWNPDIYDPEIHLDEDQLAEFVTTFAQGEEGQRIEMWIKGGAKCEVPHDEPHDALARASIDWTGVTVSDSLLVCMEDLRPAYRRMTEDGRKQGMNPTLTINGKEVPRMPAAEGLPNPPAPEI